MKAKTVYLGIKGSVVAVEAGTGRQLWARQLKGVDLVNVMLDGDRLYAATHGEVFCLDPRSGAIRWHNPLKGWGWGMISIAVEGSRPNSGLTLAAERRRRNAEASSAAVNATG